MTTLFWNKSWFLIFVLADISLLISTNLKNERFVTACDKELSKSIA